METNETYLTWLNNAYAMEQSAGALYEQFASDFNEHAQLEARTREHLELTRSQAERLKGCIERLGGDVSGAKSMLGSASGTLQGLMSEFYEDQVMKNLLAAYTAEQFEIASYTSLIAAAEELGDEETLQACQMILEEEEEMADWLLDYIPQATRRFLSEETIS